MLSSGAILGVVASSTLARGDSRRVALEQSIRNGWEIYRAVRDRTWPTATVNVRICILWATNSDLPQDLPRVADGQEVDAIDSTLELKTGTTGLSPSTLAENEDMAFIGVYPNGSGFRIAEPLARSWITTDAKNRDVLFPYITGADLNGTPDHSASMWVIDFGIRTLEAASEYCLPFEHVECTVRMERAKNKDRSRREIWWLFTRRSKALMQQISSLRHFIGMRQSSQIMQPVMLPSGSLIDQTVVAFASDDYGLFGSLASTFHQLWILRYGLALGKAPRYTPSDVFTTFPFPHFTEPMRDAGRELNVIRSEIMKRRGLGIEKLYKLVNDPRSSDVDAERLRQVHINVDQTVLASYAWSDMTLDYGFNVYRNVPRWSVGEAAREEIFARLLGENHRRAALRPYAGGNIESHDLREGNA